MKYRKVLTTSEALGQWYESKYRRMGGTWVTPAEECNRHLDDIGIPSDTWKRLLDVGCGGAYLLAEAIKRKLTCSGIELSELAISEARHRAPEATIHRRSIEEPWIKSYWDYIVALGSLEHVLDIDLALDNIRDFLRPDGRWYFYVPNEIWLYEDQPNERTATEEEWKELFAKHGLITDYVKRWGAETAFAGGKQC